MKADIYADGDEQEDNGEAETEGKEGSLTVLLH